MMAEREIQPTVRWYFDFISPFAYLQHEIFKIVRQNRPGFEVTPVPVLFAGLLKHFEHKGPAEIEPKRTLTYRYCAWYAARHGIAYSLPALHPFNPLPLLRLSLARQNDPAVIDRLFQHVWQDSSGDPAFHTVESIQRIPGFEQAATEIGDEAVKTRLRENTEQAISRGVFGVPTLEVDSQLFWGVDMTEMALEHLHPA